MILYDFQCLKCQHKFEQFSDNPDALTECEKCGKVQATRIPSGSFSIKGCPTPKFHGND